MKTAAFYWTCLFLLGCAADVCYSEDVRELPIAPGKTRRSPEEEIPVGPYLDEARGISNGLLGSALYTLGKLTLGQETVDRITPVVQGLQQLSNALPAVDIKDGKIVLGETAAASSTASPAVEPSAEKGGSKSEESSATSAPKPPPRTCTTPSGGVGKCKDLGNCPVLLLDLSSLRKSICFQSLFVPGVCCPDETLTGDVASFINRLTTTTTSRPPTTKRIRITENVRRTTTTPAPGPITEVSFPIRPPPAVAGVSGVAFPEAELSAAPVRPSVVSTLLSQPTKPSEGQCGQVVAPSFRVVGGETSRPGAWPWMAAIYLHGPKGTEFWCGGSLISDRYVMTAAHCTQDNKQKRYEARLFTIRLGSYNLRDESQGEVFGVTDIRVHPQFSGFGFYNDLALFRLDHSARFNEYVQPVCLPSGNLRSSSFLGEIGTVTGWGTTYYGGRESPILREVQLPVWRNEDCDRAYFQKITEVFLCAGYADGGKDACQGDSGGPLLLNKDGRWIQIGIVSFGNKCAEPGFPGVYTRLTHFIDWIDRNAI